MLQFQGYQNSLQRQTVFWERKMHGKGHFMEISSKNGFDFWLPATGNFPIYGTVWQRQQGRDWESGEEDICTTGLCGLLSVQK